MDDLDRLPSWVNARAGPLSLIVNTHWHSDHALTAALRRVQRLVDDPDGAVW